MLRYLIRRILWAAVLFFVVTLVTYVIFFLVPNDLASKVAGQGSSQAQRARAIHYLGLDRPVYVQYGRFMWRLIKPVRGLSSTVQETASITGGKMLGTMAVSSKNFLNGALVRMEIQAKVAAKNVARMDAPVAKTNEFNSSW